MLNLPIYYTQTFKTKKDVTSLVGMNLYRNAHYHIQNKLKQHYHKLIEEQAITLEKLPFSYTLDIKVYYKNPNCDGSNIVALIEKFTLDALQEYGIVKQDNISYHLGTTWSIAGQDKENPRCEITIIPERN